MPRRLPQRRWKQLEMQKVKNVVGIPIIVPEVTAHNALRESGYQVHRLTVTVPIYAASCLREAVLRCRREALGAQRRRVEAFGVERMVAITSCERDAMLVHQQQQGGTA